MRYIGLWDNATAESYFATLKTEFYYRRVWPIKKRARIEDRHNRRRRERGRRSSGQVRDRRSPIVFLFGMIVFEGLTFIVLVCVLCEHPDWGGAGIAIPRLDAVTPAQRPPMTPSACEWR